MKRILTFLIIIFCLVSCAEEIYPNSDAYRVKYKFQSSMLVDDIILDIDYVFEFTDEYLLQAHMPYNNSDYHEITIGSFHYNDIINTKIIYDDVMYSDVISKIEIYVSKNGGPFILEAFTDKDELTYKIN